jgi:creatinine amidohydrolase
MAPSVRSYALTDLSWVEIAEHVKRDSRLIVPVGTCDQYGPHLPVGAATVVVESLARQLAAEFGVLCAPTFAYGVNLPAERAFAGSATLREKTLNRALNDLLADWEQHGFTEFILLTAQSYEVHEESLSTVAITHGRVRVVNALSIEPPEGVLPHPNRRRQHGGEVLTSLLLHLRPERVHLNRAVDVAPPKSRFAGLSRNRLSRVPIDSPGVVGSPTQASGAAGEAIYAHILQKIRERVFLSPEDPTP